MKARRQALPVQPTLADLRVWAWRRGWALPVAAGLAAAAAAGWWLQVRPLRVQLDALASAARMLPAAAAPPTTDPAAATPPPLDPATVLPPAANLLPQLRALMLEAQQRGVHLPAASYLYDDEGSGIVRLQADAGTKAGYLPLRDFLRSTLRNMPNLSLDGLRLHMDDPAQGTLDARLRISLWGRANGGPAPAAPRSSPAGPALASRDHAPAPGGALADAKRARDPFLFPLPSAPVVVQAPAPAPLPPAAPVEPPRPAAPPLPYTVLGKKREGGAWEVYLGRAQSVLIARTGAVVEGTYRVERIQPPSMVLTYLPLGVPQVLPIGEPH